MSVKVVPVEYSHGAFKLLPFKVTIYEYLASTLVDQTYSIGEPRLDYTFPQFTVGGPALPYTSTYQMLLLTEDPEPYSWLQFDGGQTKI